MCALLNIISNKLIMHIYYVVLRFGEKGRRLVFRLRTRRVLHI